MDAINNHESEHNNTKPLEMRLALNNDEIIAAQKLRYNIFYNEFGATPTTEMAAELRDFDKYDDYADHLILIDKTTSQIVGTYRLFQENKLPTGTTFYTTNEFDITPLINSGAKLLELGRSCILPEYRTKNAMQMLWQGIAAYLPENKIDLMFGCASLQGTDPNLIAEQLSYLKHYHRAPDIICPRAHNDCTKDIKTIPKDEINARRIFASLPPLIKGYLRVGGYIGDGACIDYEFNSIDVCIIVPVHKITDKYMKHYERNLNKHLTHESEFSKKFSNLL